MGEVKVPEPGRFPVHVIPEAGAASGSFRDPAARAEAICNIPDRATASARRIQETV